MNREDVINLAKEAGIEVHPRKNEARVGIDCITGEDSTEKLARFAALVAAEERRKCAKIAASLVPPFERLDCQRAAGFKAREIAKAIRSRGKP